MMRPRLGEQAGTYGIIAAITRVPPVKPDERAADPEEPDRLARSRD